VQEAVHRVVLNPKLYPIVELNVRRCFTKTFPFGIIFRELPDQFVIMAVMHLHRDPHCWQSR